jgi:transposase
VKPILECCCGIDVHRDHVTACIAYGDLSKAEEELVVKEFSTMTSELRELSRWLKKYNVKVVALESTGIYWKPVFNILEDDFEIILANARHVKNVPGLKTDKRDARWLARLLRYGLVPASFIPPKDIREFRFISRSRMKLVGEMTREKNRVQKILQDANIKLSSVMKKVFSVTGEALMRALLEKDVLSLENIESLAKGKLRNKIDLLLKAVDGRITDNHRFLLEMHFKHIDFLAGQISHIDADIYRKLQSYQKEFKLIQSIPGFNDINSASMIAEIGVDMSRFPDEKHLSSWAAICPGNNESAGKKKSGKTRRGNNYLKAILTEAAWAASRTKGTAFSEKYHNIARRRGKKRAIVAIAHQLLKEVYFVLKNSEPYDEIGAEAVKDRKSEMRERSIIRELERYGYMVQKVPLTV